MHRGYEIAPLFLQWDQDYSLPMKKHFFILTMVGLLLGVKPAYGFVTMDFEPWYGYVGTVNYASSEQYGNGFAVSANATLVWVNGGVEHKSFNEKSINNIYLGLGVGGALQLQFGTGNAGSLIKLRSDMSVKQLLKGDFEFPEREQRKTLADRWIFSFSYERYLDDNRSTNYQVGIGLLF